MYSLVSSQRSASAGKYLGPLLQVLSLAGIHSQLLSIIWNSLPPHVCIYNNARLSFALHGKLNPSSPLKALNVCLISMRTSELCKEGINKLQLYYIV